MVERAFSQSDMASVVLYGVEVTLPWDRISGDSRKMDGARDSGMGSLFFSESATFLQGLVEIAFMTSEAGVTPRSYPYPRKWGAGDQFAEVSLN